MKGPHPKGKNEKEIYSLLQLEEKELNNLWVEKVIAILKKKGIKGKLNKNSIGDKIGKEKWYRFPANRDSVIPIIINYNLTIDEAVELYKYNGLFLNKNIERDKGVFEFFENKIPEKYYSEYIFLDCLIELIINHEYDKKKSNTLFQTSKELENYYSKYKEKDPPVYFKKSIDIINSVLNKQANSNHFVIESLSKKIKSTQKRESIFEIAFLLEFNKKETKDLYKANGYFMAKKTIGYDAFVGYLLNKMEEFREEENFNPGCAYKKVCSTLLVRNALFIRTAPNLEKFTELDEQLNKTISVENVMAIMREAENDKELFEYPDNLEQSNENDNEL